MQPAVNQTICSPLTERSIDLIYRSRFNCIVAFVGGVYLLLCEGLHPIFFPIGRDDDKPWLKKAE
jgi:hypothetical protein